MKFTAWHVHRNPRYKRGSNEALTILVKGFTCDECRKAKRAKPARGRDTLQGPKNPARRVHSRQ